MLKGKNTKRHLQIKVTKVGEIIKKSLSDFLCRDTMVDEDSLQRCI